MLNDLAGKTALVTGGGRGIGRAIAVRLARSGAVVAVNFAKDAEAAHATVAMIEAEGGGAFPVQARLGDVDETGRLVDAVGAGFMALTGTDRLDILVNNVGGNNIRDDGRSGYMPIGDMTIDQYDHVMTNNVRAAFIVTKLLLDRINDHGRVINISSAGARLTDTNILVYSMAKAAIETFTRIMAAELGPRGITVNAVAPGFTAGETNANVEPGSDVMNYIVESTALRRFGQPDEIADIVYSLASPLGRWVTAQVIDASGGFKL